MSNSNQSSKSQNTKTLSIKTETIIQDIRRLQKPVNMKQKYGRLLNNLLEIQQNDPALFTRIGERNKTFDVVSKFGKLFANDAVNKPNFQLQLIEEDYHDILSFLSTAANYDDVMKVCNKYKFEVSQEDQENLKIPLQFKRVLKRIMTDLNVLIQKNRSRWLQFRRQGVDHYLESNIWPLHLATLFISFKNDKHLLYAPLLFKEVTIFEKDSKMYLSGENNWQLNEKLIYILNSIGYGIDPNWSVNGLSIESIREQIINMLLIKKSDFNLIAPFKAYTNSFTAEKNVLTLHSGVVFGFYQPAGGLLRRKMLDIIANDELDQIIEVQPDKNVYRRKIKSFIRYETQKILRVQKTNFSQDQALGSALTQNTIIWGPPGTGKSQVIANIVANILFRDKSAVVVSQKKAALDVLIKRLGKLSSFCFFMLNYQNKNKREFYEPLKEFLELVENPEMAQKKQWKNPIISRKQILTLNSIAKSHNKRYYDSTMRLIDIFKKDRELLKRLFNLDFNLKYPAFKDPNLVTMKIAAAIAEKNNIDRKGFIFKKYPTNLLDSAQLIGEVLQKHSRLDLHDLIVDLKSTDWETIEAFERSPEILKPSHRFHSDEDYLVSYLSRKIILRIKNWQTENEEMYTKYVNFANAIRAGRQNAVQFNKDHLEVIRALFGVYVATPESLIVDWDKNSFDYAILDESSQMFLEVGLPILYIAKIKILAGDLQQLRPTRWFMIRADDYSNLDDVAENANSLLDYAFDKGVYQVMLDQNYRSTSAALMAFSARHFYNSRLEVVDDIAKRDFVSITVRNIDGMWSNGVNYQEANEVLKIVNQQFKKFKSIIVLTFNAAQKFYIERKIIDKYPKLFTALDDGNLMVRNIENIQGDEADLVIASVVYDSTTNTAGTYVSRPGGKNALNVAISRAKNKMIVIKSVHSDNIKPANSEDFGIFRKWLEFLDMSVDQQRNYSQLGNAKELDSKKSEVNKKEIKDVIDTLKNQFRGHKNLRFESNFGVGSQSVDIAVLSKGNKFVLGINVCKFDYRPSEAVEEFLSYWAKQEFLGLKGYKTYTINLISWKINHLHEVNQLQKKLTKIIGK